MKVIILLVVVFVILPVFSAFFFLPFGVSANIFGKQYRYSLRDYKKVQAGESDPLLVGCENLSVQKEYVSIRGKDGVRLLGEAIDRKSDETVIFLHGYRSNPQRDFSGICQSFLQEGYNVLLIHQRAHGLSGGKHCLAGLTEQYDIDGWLEWCKDNSFGKTFVLYGMSMGGATVGYASGRLEERGIKAFVIDCAYMSAYELMCDFSKNRLPNWLAKYAIGSAAWIGRVFLKTDIRQTVSESLKKNFVPTAFLGGGADKTVPIEIVKRNYEANAGEKILLIAENATHAKAFREENVKKEVFAFLKNIKNKN